VAFHVRTMEQKDFPFAVRLANSVNWNMGEADFEFNKHLEPGGCLILEADSKPIGLATCISYGRIGWFGNLVVDKACRNKGAGTQLIRHAMNYLKNKGVATVGLYAYPHLMDFYGKIGFRADNDFVVLKTAAVSIETTSDSHMKVAKAQDFKSIFDLDGSCFGNLRRRLLQIILKNPANICCVAAEGSQTVGFAAAKVFGEAAEVGPLVCKGDEPETAVALLKFELRKLNGFEAYIYLPASEFALLETAAQAGFGEEFRLKRMFIGAFTAKNCLYSAESLERG
jgi:N-acetylglutamate synthase-like GNAT family acetyltransferase